MLWWETSGLHTPIQPLWYTGCRASSSGNWASRTKGGHKMIYNKSQSPVWYHMSLCELLFNSQSWTRAKGMEAAPKGNTLSRSKLIKAEWLGIHNKNNCKILECCCPRSPKLLCLALPISREQPSPGRAEEAASSSRAQQCPTAALCRALEPWAMKIAWQKEYRKL